MKLLEATTQIHSNAVAHGWWESPRSEKDILMLVISEVAEATEEVRNNKPSTYYVALNEDAGKTQDYPCTVENFPEGVKPEGEAVELADAFIRLLDYAGYKGLDLNDQMAMCEDSVNGVDVALDDILSVYDRAAGYDYFRDASPLDVHHDIVQALFISPITERKVMECIIRICRYFKHKGWGLNDVVELKVAYNLKRPYRHGGKSY